MRIWSGSQNSRRSVSIAHVSFYPFLPKLRERRPLIRKSTDPFGSSGKRMEWLLPNNPVKESLPSIIKRKRHRNHDIATREDESSLRKRTTMIIGGPSAVSDLHQSTGPIWQNSRPPSLKNWAKSELSQRTPDKTRDENQRLEKSSKNPKSR